MLRRRDNDLTTTMTLAKSAHTGHSARVYEVRRKVGGHVPDQPWRVMRRAAIFILLTPLIGCGSTDGGSTADSVEASQTTPLPGPPSIDSSPPTLVEPTRTSVVSTAWIPVMPPAEPPVALLDVPVLLPEPLASAGELGRSGPDEPGTPSQTVLQIYGNPEGDWLHVGSTSPASPATSGEQIGPWVVTDKSGVNASMVELDAPNVTVTLWSLALDSKQLRVIAAQMRQQPDGSWNLGTLPHELTLVAKGPTTRWTARRIVQTDPNRGRVLALEVLPDSVSLLSSYFDGEARVVELDGQRALYSESQLSWGTLSTLVWSYSPRIIVRFGVVDAGLDEMLRMARALRPGTEDQWKALTDVSDGDGCPGFWC